MSFSCAGGMGEGNVHKKKDDEEEYVRATTPVHPSKREEKVINEFWTAKRHSWLEWHEL